MLAMLRTEKASPGCRPRVTDGHTRESEQANTRYLGDWWALSGSNVSGFLLPIDRETGRQRVNSLHIEQEAWENRE
jgi:hypothetical protein